jgi:hypothetical protein
MAPAASVGPSVPSVPPLSTTTPSLPARSMAAASTNSWFLPPSPPPRRVTVVSPPEIRHTGGLAGRPDARISRAIAACIRATSRVSPSMRVESTSGRSPNSRAFRAAASTASRLLPTTRFVVRSNTGSPGFGVSAISPRAPRSIRSPTAAGIRSQSPYFSRIALAPANVDASGAVGPEPITSRSSPITSDSSSDSTSAG